METVVEVAVTTLSHELGEQLQACYLYGSYGQPFYQSVESDVNLLFVLADGSDIHALRTAFMPVWQKYQQILGVVPLFAEQTAFKRHLQLNPLFAAHLAEGGQMLVGNSPVVSPVIDQKEAVARLAGETIQASSMLAAHILESEEVSLARTLLYRLVRQVRGDLIAEEETAVSLYTLLQTHLQAQVEQLALDSTWTMALPAEPSPLFHDLQAIYRHQQGHVLLVFTQLLPETILTADWHTLGSELSVEYSGLQVTTSQQLRLFLQLENPLDVRLRQYQHEWGLDPLANFTYESWRLFRQAARRPSLAQIAHMPQEYLVSSEEEAGTIIHDFQNLLLKVQLEHELLSRFGDITRFTLPGPLPGRETPSPQRIEAILATLSWWADRYTEAMLTARQP